MKSENLPLLIFDLDGTLIDSAPDIHTAMNMMLARHKKSQVSLETLTSHIGDGLSKLVHDFFPEYPMNTPEAIAKVEEFLDLYSDKYLTERTQLYPGVYEFLSEYKGPKALVTNKNIDPTHQIFSYFKLDKLNWVDVLGGDSLVERKPSALPLEYIMKKINYTPQNTWMIGDGRPDMKAAQAAGCLKGAVHYGYSRPEELHIFKPDLILHKFIDIKTHFG